MRSAAGVLLLLTFSAANAAGVVDYSNFAREENGFATAWDSGADAVELDVYVSSDAIAYLFHDDQIGAPGNHDWTYATLVDKYSYNIPALAELGWTTVESGTVIFNLRDESSERTRSAITTIQSLPIPAQNIIIQSDNFDVLGRVRQAWPEVRRSYETPLNWKFPYLVPPSPVELVEKLSTYGVDRISLKGRVFVTAEFIRTLKLGGQEVYVWTINPGFRAAHYLQLGVDGIVTKRPRTIRQEISRFEEEIENPKTVIYPLALFRSTDPNFEAYRQFREILQNGKPLFDKNFLPPNLPLQPVFVNCQDTRRLGVVLQVIRVPRQEDFAGHLAWVRNVGSSVVKFYWAHSAFPDDDRILYSRSRLRPYLQNSIYVDGITLKKKHKVDGRISVRITKDDVDLYSASFELIDCDTSQ